MEDPGHLEAAECELGNLTLLVQRHASTAPFICFELQVRDDLLFQQLTPREQNNSDRRAS